MESASKIGSTICLPDTGIKGEPPRKKECPEEVAAIFSENCDGPSLEVYDFHKKEYVPVHKESSEDSMRDMFL